MARRLELQAKLESILGSEYVYFQPPKSVEMVYPCIVFSLSSAVSQHANNAVYSNRLCYQVMVIDPDPDSETPGKIAALPLCSFDRHYTKDNLNHDVYNLYF